MRNAIRHRTSAIILGGGLLWIGLVTLAIVHEPKPGTTSVRMLADRYQAAVAGGKAEELAQLYDYPGIGPDYAKELIDQLKDAGAGAIAVQPATTPSGHPALEVSGRLRGGQAFTHLLRVDRSGDRWVVKPLPPV